MLTKCRTHLSTLITLAGLSLLALPAAAQPSVSAVINAANADITTLARGSFVSIFGSNLGTKAGPPSALPLPTTMGGAVVNFKPASGSATYQAFLHFVSPGQINAIIPSAVPAGPTDVTVTVNNVTSSARRIQVAESAFGIFTINSQPAGIAIAQNYESATSLPLNLYTNPARPGQTLILWGTGLGAYTAGPDSGPPQAGNIVNNAQVLVAGSKITPFYAGRAPGIPGVDQINFTLPDTMPIPDGCSLQVQVQIGTFIQNGMATIAKSSNAPACDHPFALSTDQLSSLQTGSTLKAGVARITRIHGIQGFVNGSALGSLGEEIEVHVRKFTANGSPLTNQSYPFALSQAPGSCSAMQVPGSSLDYIDHFDTAGSAALDTGSKFTLSGPGASIDLNGAGGDASQTIYQGAEIPGVSSASSVLVDGDWTLSASGGKDIGAFQAHFTLQNQFKLQNVPTSLTKGQPFTVTWTGGGDNDPVRIILFGTLFSGPPTVITCTALAGAHTFNVPGNFTSQVTGDVPTGVLIVYYMGAPVSFSAPNLDSGKISMSILESFTSLTLR